MPQTPCAPCALLAPSIVVIVFLALSNTHLVVMLFTHARAEVLWFFPHTLVYTIGERFTGREKNLPHKIGTLGGDPPPPSIGKENIRARAPKRKTLVARTAFAILLSWILLTITVQRNIRDLSVSFSLISVCAHRFQGIAFMYEYWYWLPLCTKIIHRRRLKWLHFQPTAACCAIYWNLCN